MRWLTSEAYRSRVSANARRRRTVILPADGFSSDTVPRCCPDVHTALTWRWNGDRYVLDGTPPPHVTFP